jgi:hypothetical protein
LRNSEAVIIAHARAGAAVSELQSRRDTEHERPSQGAEVSDSQDFSEVVRAAGEVAQMLEAALEILQTAQSTIPAPTLEQVAEIRLGRRPLTQEAYLIGNLQRAILGAENVVSDLRAIDLETLRNVHELGLSGLELNAIGQAVAERAQGGARARAGDGE